MAYTYLWCFFLFSFLGWCSEVVFAAVRERRFVNRGFLNGPLCPIYGLGVVAIDFFLRPFGSSLPVQLVGAMLLAIVFVPEFGVGQGVWYSVFHSISAF